MELSQDPNYIQAETSDLPKYSPFHGAKLRKDTMPTMSLINQFNQYLEGAKNDLPEVDYDEFGRKWLPLFNYEDSFFHPQEEGDVGSNSPLIDWVHEVAKSPYSEVKIMGYRDGHYVEVARVPPIFDPISKLFHEDDFEHFANLAVMESAKLTGASRDGQAQQYIKDAFVDRLDLETIDALSRNFYRMCDIFRMYGHERRVPNWIKGLEEYRKYLNGDKSKVSDIINNPEDKPVNSASSGIIEED